MPDANDTTGRAAAIAALCANGSIHQLRAISAVTAAAIAVVEIHRDWRARIRIGADGVTLSFDDTGAKRPEPAAPAPTAVPAPTPTPNPLPVPAEVPASLPDPEPEPAPVVEAPPAPPPVKTGPFSLDERQILSDMAEQGQDARTIAIKLGRGTAAVALMVSRRKPRADAQPRETNPVVAQIEPNPDDKTAPAPEPEPTITPPAPAAAPTPAPVASPAFTNLKSALAAEQAKQPPSPLQAHLKRRTMQGWTADMDLQLMEMSFDGAAQDVISLELGKSAKEIRQRFDCLTCGRKFKMADVVAELRRRAPSRA